jgi:uncharacterized protein with gpF-like domain
VRPVWTNVGVHRWYYDALDRLLREATDDLDERLRKAWDEAPPAIGFAHDAVGNLDRALAVWGRKWGLKFERMADSIADSFAAKSQRVTEFSMRAMLKDAGFTVAFKPTRKSVEAYKAVAAENVALIRSIGQKYHTDVQERVWNAVRVGNDLSKLSIDLRKTYGISVKRAALISRDQANKARAVMEATRRQELGIIEAVWVHSHAGKVPRPEHVAWGREKKRFRLDRGMYSDVDGAYVWPGTPINCRCSSRAIIPGIRV